MSHLAGKVALVTGASKGIGAGIAKELAKHGASVVVNYSTSKVGADKVVAEIKGAGGKAVAVGGSVAKSEDIDKIIAETKKNYGKIDILVNNAGVYGFAPLEQVTAEEIARMYGVNVTGLLLLSKAALPLFPAEGGSIINVSSIAAESAPAAGSVYSGTKGAVNSITRSLANELGPKKIRVNAVAPGPVSTEGFDSLGGKDLPFVQETVKITPLGRIGEPVDVAQVVAFLAGDGAAWVTGSVIDTAGGFR
jgi:3-oxoacyl-[acyl-carrier protein] reductase